MITEQDMIKDILDGHYANGFDDIKITTNPIVCLWSGGCDSTLVLFTALKRLKEWGDQRTIKTYSFIHHQLDSRKMDLEKQRRNMFLAWLEDNGYSGKVQHIDIHIDRHEISASGCPQAALWVINLIPLVESNSIILTGYHKGDCFWEYSVFSDWVKLTTGLLNLFGKNPKFVMPLRDTTKYRIIEKLKTENIYKFTWYCEMPKSDGTVCDYCLPCETHKMSLDYYTYRQGEHSKPAAKPVDDIEGICKALESVLDKEKPKEEKKEVIYPEFYGFDLDGTIAYTDGKHDDFPAVGAPIPEMIKKIKEYLALGRNVKIFTARYARKDENPGIVPAIEKWCIENIGQVLDITNIKTPGMKELWDDRAISVKRNGGKAIRYNQDGIAVED